MNTAAYQRQAQAESAGSIPLRTAYLCYAEDCLTITNSAPHGVCRLCGSGAIRPVAELLRSSEERAAWLEKIQGVEKRG